MSKESHKRFCKKIAPVNHDEILQIIDTLIPNDEIVPNSVELISRFKQLYLQGNFLKNSEAIEIWNTLIHLENGEKVIQKLWLLLIHNNPSFTSIYELPDTNNTELISQLRDKEEGDDCDGCISINS